MQREFMAIISHTATRGGYHFTKRILKMTTT